MPRWVAWPTCSRSSWASWATAGAGHGGGDARDYAGQLRWLAAMGQFMVQNHRRGEPFWSTFFRGGVQPAGESDDKAASTRPFWTQRDGRCVARPCHGRSQLPGRQRRGLPADLRCGTPGFLSDQGHVPATLIRYCKTSGRACVGEVRLSRLNSTLGINSACWLTTKHPCRALNRC